ncbi:peptidase S9, prolyl oligopeptidase [Naviculisporaceae sp. PSN 640]
MLARLVLLATFFLAVSAYAVPDKEAISPHWLPEDGLDTEVAKTARRQTAYPRFTVQEFNIWVTYNSTSQQQQLTTTGTRENPFDGSKVYVSPYKSFAVVWQYTPQQERKFTLIESSPSDRVEPKRHEIPSLRPGDRVRIDRPRLFNLDSRAETPTDDTLFQNPYELRNIGWSANSNEYRFLFNERGHQHLRVIGMDINGRVRALVEESSETFIDYGTPGKDYRHVIPPTDELIWASERDGWNHLYLYDLGNGTLKNQITRGNWLVRSVERVDLVSRRIWFSTYGIYPGQDPYYTHLARINFDGTNLTTLTSGNGDHSWTYTDDGRQLVDTWSRIDQQPTVALRDAETGELIRYMQPPPTGPSPVSAIVERFAAAGRDGTTQIYGIIVKPSTLDPSKKYPIIEDIYGGPQEFSTPKAYNPDSLNGMRAWADQGYIVVKLDGMGTNYRSKAFHNVCYRNLRDGGLPDRIAWIKSAASSRPWMDTTRVGIIGSSAGGQNAMAAVLDYGDFYKAAVADSGCHENRLGQISWTEKWMGVPTTPEGQQAYEESSNVVNAAKLNGKLLLIVGDLDNNVDPSNTLQVVHALNVANKDHELLFVPGAGHGAGDGPYARRRTEEFFRKNLIEG